ncbi:MAG: aconitate hydratase [Candidatus Marinimicrobia bacterium]|nr:aconitate hydratase [Candidatus Neomarinimicrobiota bacterium]
MDQTKIVKKTYSKYVDCLPIARNFFNRPLTYTEKILFSHLSEPLESIPKRTKTFCCIKPDRVAMQDATAQMALLQFINSGMNTTAVPSTVHCDHLITAINGAKDDLDNALITNKEVYNFLISVCEKYGIGFWKPGAGIIHQTILENYAFPGSLMIGTDSHTPNAGGLGMIAIGVGGADAVDVMTDSPWEVNWPGVIGVKLTGELKDWASPKDIILKLAGILTVKGGTGKIIEYFGEGTKTISCTGKATITNMGAEVGATTSLFPYDKKMFEYLVATSRSDIADLAEKLKDDLKADKQVEEYPEKYYDEVIEINLSELEPHIVGPYSPDLSRKVSEMPSAIKENGYDDDLKVGLIGSCTNSSYEDIEKAAHVAKQALDKGLKAKSEFYITPGSNQIKATMERDGYTEIFQKLGGKVLANACGPCIGQWRRSDVQDGEKNTIITSFNRNFAKRNDGNAATESFVASPEIVTALTISGKLSFNPSKDSIPMEDGSKFMFDSPIGSELPEEGFADIESSDFLSGDLNPSAEIIIDKNSSRLQTLEPFEKWNNKEIKNLRVLLKAEGKCTTDHVSPAGPWLKYRGHLENISQNMYSGALNAYTQSTGEAINTDTKETNDIYEVAQYYKSNTIDWIAVADENYGEGSSREHAAMEPRFMGCKIVLAKSFARIAQTNLKKQGILPLIFQNKSDYNKIEAFDTISTMNLNEFDPSNNIDLILTKPDGSTHTIETMHTFSDNQISWFKAGSALNLIADQKN